MENLRTSARAGVHASSFHFLQSLFDGELRDARKIVHFDHSECFEVNVRMALFQSADEFKEIFKGQIRVQTADDMKLGGAFAYALVRALENLIERVRVGSGSVRIAAECAKFAVCN